MVQLEKYIAFSSIVYQSASPVFSKLVFLTRQSTWVHTVKNPVVCTGRHVLDD